GADLDGQTCMSLGNASGTLACAADCSAFNLSGCSIPSTCGNGVREGAEACDGADLDGQTCMSLGNTSGTLACAADCSAFNLSGCSIPSTCGNGVREGAEACDGADLDGQTCMSLGT